MGLVAAQVGEDIVSPLMYDGTMNSTLFELWFENRLMYEIPQNSVIIMEP